MEGCSRGAFSRLRTSFACEAAHEPHMFEFSPRQVVTRTSRVTVDRRAPGVLSRRTYARSPRAHGPVACSPRLHTCRTAPQLHRGRGHSGSVPSLSPSDRVSPARRDRVGFFTFFRFPLPPSSLFLSLSRHRVASFS